METKLIFFLPEVIGNEFATYTAVSPSGEMDAGVKLNPLRNVHSLLKKGGSGSNGSIGFQEDEQ